MKKTRTKKILILILIFSLFSNIFYSTALANDRITSLIKEIYPATTGYIAGNDFLEVSAVAYFGSNVTANLDGITIALTPDVNSTLTNDYMTYIGIFKIDKATTKSQNIGKIKFTATYSGSTQSKYSGDITILPINSVAQEADYPKVDEDGNIPSIDDDTEVEEPEEPTEPENPFEGEDTTELKKPKEDKTPIFPSDAFNITPDGSIKDVIEVTDYYADTYSYKSSYYYPDSAIYSLTQGTIDVVKAKRGDLLDLASGHTIRLSDKQVKMYKSETYMANKMASAYTYSNVDGTFFSFRLGAKTPVTVDVTPYPKNAMGVSSCNPKQIIINFPYLTDVTELNGDFLNSQIIKNYKWEKYTFENSIKGYRLILDLSKVGQYYGAHTYYDENDRLTIKFNNPPYGIGSDKPLTGIEIIVDPGHGGSDPGSIGASKKKEKTYNQEQATLLVAELRKQGAKVYMLDTDTVQSSKIEVSDRAKKIYEYKPDLFLSVHHNAATSKSATGFEVFYNAPFGYELAKAVAGQFSEIMTVRRYAYYNFQATRNAQVPSILLEHFFITTAGDEKKYGTDEHKLKMAKAATQGIIDYYTKLSK